MSSPERGTHGKLAGIGTMCATMLLWPVGEAIPSFFSHHYSAFEIVWVRYGTHLLLMLVLWAPGGPARLVRTRRPGLHAVRALTMLGMPVFYVLAITRMPVDAILSLLWVAPLLAMLLAAVWLREWTGWRQWIAAATAYLGAVVIAGRPAIGLHAAAVLPLALRAVPGAHTLHARRDRGGPPVLHRAGRVGPARPRAAVVLDDADTARSRPDDADGRAGLPVPARPRPGAGRRARIQAGAVHAGACRVGCTRRRRVDAASAALGAVAGVAIVLVAWLAFAWPQRSEATPTPH
jgi:EamA-like transporter family